MKVLLLAAGYGTRLYPLTRDQPKPLLEVGDQPMIDHLLDRLSDVSGISDVILVSNDRFAEDFSTWAREQNRPWPVSVVNDGTEHPDEKRGAIGDIQYVLDQKEIDSDLFVIGGDNYFEFSLRSMVETFRETGENTVGAILFDDREKCSRYGILDVNSEGIVNEFLEKPDHPPSRLVSMAMYLFPRNKLSLIEKYLEEGGNPDETGSYMEYLVECDHLRAHVFEGTWFDIGDRDSLERARTFVKKQSN